ncbi:acetyltransferase [Flammeovirga pacifica]|uniref:PglD N-terminal domain-containing protein n=1 Tax=Flammeovirga pacifica TaxID=915059 RepID=A0A1S1YXI0_FLAPC|nr:acetyltransferase [Flammeovirga pacifica]OHX65565.1 hypothetical protein NH26_03980 [Flammeovirga pacifica]
MKEDIILIGGGGHCHAVIDIIELNGNYNILGIVDLPELLSTPIMDYKVIGNDDDLPQLSKTCKNFILTTGQIKSPSLRVKLSNLLNEELNVNWPTIVSPLAYVSEHAELGKGNVIMHNAVINSKTKIGNFNIINTNAIIEHDCVVGNFCHISTGVILNGNVNLANNIFCGSHSTVNNNLSIDSNIVIGSHSLVNRSLNQKGIYLGVPVIKK